MGHGRGAHFTSNGFLLEVTQADVAPHIPVKVKQDGVEAHDHSKQLSYVVMRLDLQTQPAVSKLLFSSIKKLGFAVY